MQSLKSVYHIKKVDKFQDFKMHILIVMITAVICIEGYKFPSKEGKCINLWIVVDGLQ